MTLSTTVRYFRTSEVKITRNWRKKSKKYRKSFKNGEIGCIIHLQLDLGRYRMIECNIIRHVGWYCGTIYVSKYLKFVKTPENIENICKINNFAYVQLFCATNISKISKSPPPSKKSCVQCYVLLFYTGICHIGEVEMENLPYFTIFQAFSWLFIFLWLLRSISSYFDPQIALKSRNTPGSGE